MSPARNRVTPTRRHRRHPPARRLDGQSGDPPSRARDRPVPCERPLDHLRARVPRPLARAMAAAPLHLAVLPRRGGLVRGRSSPVRRVPARQLQRLSRRLGRRPGRSTRRPPRRSTGGCTASGSSAVPTGAGCTSSTGRDCRTASSWPSTAHPRSSSAPSFTMDPGRLRRSPAPPSAGRPPSSRRLRPSPRSAPVIPFMSRTSRRLRPRAERVPNGCPKRGQSVGSRTWKRVSPGLRLAARISPWLRTTMRWAMSSPRPGALADRLRREERVEDARLAASAGMPRSVVADLDETRWPWLARAHGDPAASADGVDRVVDQVRPDLVELGPRRLDGRQVGVELAHDLDLLRAQLVRQQRERALEALVDVDRLARRPGRGTSSR